MLEGVKSKDSKLSSGHPFVERQKKGDVMKKPFYEDIEGYLRELIAEQMGWKASDIAPCPEGSKSCLRGPTSYGRLRPKDADSVGDKFSEFSCMGG